MWRGLRIPKWRKQTISERLLLAEKLRLARKEAGLTQREAAELLGFDSHSIICELENGQRRIDVIELKTLAEIYKKDPAWFLRD